MDIKSLPQSVRTRLRSGIKITSVPHCVTELVLNSLDAKSTAVVVRVNLTSCRLQVIDNGDGISKSNMYFLGIRFMTSKCQSITNLESKTKFYGFRGETLSSLIEVSKNVNVVSRTGESQETFSVDLDGKTKPAQIKKRPCKGTSVTVESFLHNFPVRKNRINPELDFEDMKANLLSLAVIHPEASFSLRNDSSGKIIFQNKKADSVQEAFIAIHPGLDAEEFAEIKISKGKTTISGLIYRKTHANSLQYIYVNKRPISSSKIKSILNSLLMRSKIHQKDEKTSKKFVYVINIRCPHSEVDLVLNPNKTTAEFKNWDVIDKALHKVVAKIFQLEETIAKAPSNESKNIPSHSGVSQIQGAFKSRPIKRKTKVIDAETNKKQKSNAMLLLQASPNERKSSTDESEMFLSATQPVNQLEIEVEPKNKQQKITNFGISQNISRHLKRKTKEIDAEPKKRQKKISQLETLQKDTKPSSCNSGISLIVGQITKETDAETKNKHKTIKTLRLGESHNQTKWTSDILEVRQIEPRLTHQKTKDTNIKRKKKHKRIENLQLKQFQSEAKPSCSKLDAFEIVSRLNKRKTKEIDIEMKGNVTNLPISNSGITEMLNRLVVPATKKKQKKINQKIGVREKRVNVVKTEHPPANRAETKSFFEVPPETTDKQHNKTKKLQKPMNIFEKHANTQSLVLNSELSSKSPEGNTQESLELLAKDGKKLILDFFLQSTQNFNAQAPKTVHKKQNTTMTLSVCFETENNRQKLISMNRKACVVEERIETVQERDKNPVSMLFSRNESNYLFNFEARDRNKKQHVETASKCIQTNLDKSEMVSKCLQTTLNDQNWTFRFDTTQASKNFEQAKPFLENKVTTKTKPQIVHFGTNSLLVNNRCKVARSDFSFFDKRLFRNNNYVLRNNCNESKRIVEDKHFRTKLFQRKSNPMETRLIKFGIPLKQFQTEECNLVDFWKLRRQTQNAPVFQPEQKCSFDLEFLQNKRSFAEKAFLTNTRVKTKETQTKPGNFIQEKTKTAIKVKKNKSPYEDSGDDPKQRTFISHRYFDENTDTRKILQTQIRQETKDDSKWKRLSLKKRCEINDKRQQLFSNNNNLEATSILFQKTPTVTEYTFPTPNINDSNFSHLNYTLENYIHLETPKRKKPSTEVRRSINEVVLEIDDSSEDIISNSEDENNFKPIVTSTQVLIEKASQKHKTSSKNEIMQKNALPETKEHEQTNEKRNNCNKNKMKQRNAFPETKEHEQTNEKRNDCNKNKVKQKNALPETKEHEQTNEKRNNCNINEMKQKNVLLETKYKKFANETNDIQVIEVENFDDYNLINEKENIFGMRKRIDFVPKGLSPILIDIKPVDISLSPNSKVSLVENLLGNDHQLNTVKWENYLQNKDAKKFFDEIYEEKKITYSLILPDVSNSIQSDIKIPKTLFQSLEVVGQWDCKFIVAKHANLLILFDQHAVDERIRLETILNSTNVKFQSRQYNIKISLNSADSQLLSMHGHRLTEFGLKYVINRDHLNITHVPECVYEKGSKHPTKCFKIVKLLIKTLIEEEISNLKTTRGVVAKIPRVLQHIFNSEACRGSIKFGNRLNQDDCRNLIQQLSGCRLPFQCAHGRPTLVPLIDLKRPTKHVSDFCE